MDKPFEMQGESTGALTPERTAFIMKVYGLLTAAMFVAGIGASMGSFISITMFFPIFVLSLVTMIAALVLRKVPGLNMALLFGFTFLDGLISGPVINFYVAKGQGHVVTQALFMTFATFGSLTAYVFWSKKDFSYLRGFLFAALWGLIIVGLCGFFFRFSSGFSLLFSYVGLLTFVGFTLYDTSNLIHKFNTDEYVVATLELFLDIVNLFWFILDILSSRD